MLPCGWLPAFSLICNSEKEKDCLTKPLWSEVHSDRTNNGGNRNLFILDGSDELSQEIDCNDDMFQFLQELFSLARLHNHIPAIRETFKVPTSSPPRIGSHHEVEVYVEKAFTHLSTGKTNFKKVDDAQSYLRANQLIQSLVCIPIQLDAFCDAWSDEFISNRTLKILTNLYEAVEEQS